jgi:hypothetical protein
MELTRASGLHKSMLESLNYRVKAKDSARCPRSALPGFLPNLSRARRPRRHVRAHRMRAGIIAGLPGCEGCFRATRHLSQVLAVDLPCDVLRQGFNEEELGWHGDPRQPRANRCGQVPRLKRFALFACLPHDERDRDVAEISSTRSETKVAGYATFASAVKPSRHGIGSIGYGSRKKTATKHRYPRHQRILLNEAAPASTASPISVLKI